MNSKNEILENVLKRCDIMLDNQIISKEMLMQSFALFFSQTYKKRKHNVGIVMHTGSVCFDVLALTYAAIISLISSETMSDEIIETLRLDDVVLYGEKKKERYVFKGKLQGASLSKDYVGKMFIKLAQGNGKICYVPEKSWHLIEPYNGDSKRLDGRGIRKKNTSRDDFFVEVLGYQKECVPSITDTSSVIVLSKEKADFLVKGISFKFGEKKISLLELVTASYYTEEDEYCYMGNIGKNEPVLKLVGKISAARKLIYSKQGNFNIGLMVLESEIIRRGIDTELPELINRKSLQYVYLCVSLNLECGLEKLLSENEEIEVFACTKDFLLKASENTTRSNNKYTYELLRQMKNVVEKENELVLIQNAPIEWKEYVLFKNNLLWIKRNDFISDEKNHFIVYAHSLMNLFITAIFSMSTLTKAKEQGIIDITTPREKLIQMEKWSSMLPKDVKEKAENVIYILNTTYNRLHYEIGKATWVYEFLRQSENKRVAIIVPKAYYASVIKSRVVRYYRRNLDITTPDRFDEKAVYDAIIVVGNVEGRRFNAFRCNSSLKIISILYQVETKVYAYQKQCAKSAVHALQKRSTIKVLMDNEQEAGTDENNDENILEQDAEINDYISGLDLIVETKQVEITNAVRNNNVNTEIVAIATFSDDSRAYFSKNYKGYILDETTGTIKEEEAKNFCEGDSLVFTKNNDETKDIVDSILIHLIQGGKLSDDKVDAYNKSKFWKRTLIEYMHKKNISMQQVANRMIRNGVSVQEPTICRWLDEDAHTVGPRDVESIVQIGILVGNDDLNNNANIYFDACKKIRSIRRQILKEIGQAIIGKLSGKPQNAGGEYTEIYDRVDSLAEILQIERLVFVERNIPMSMANRPIQI